MAVVRTGGQTGRVVAGVAACLLLVLPACGGSTEDPDDSAPGLGPAPPGTPAPGDGTGEEPPGEQPGATGPVAVYYVGEEQVVAENGGSQQRPRLYREFHQLDVGDGSVESRLHAAVSHLLTPGSALDPDYVSLWPDTAAVSSVSVTGDTATVDLTGADDQPGIGMEEAEIAVQQLVWTVTAEPVVDRVQMLFDGDTVFGLWGQAIVEGPRERAPAIDTLALLWLISPQHGQSVGTTFEVHVYGAPFEATAQLRARQGATVVYEDFVTLGGTGFPEFFGEAKVSLTLDPGTYTLEVFELSAVDGSEIRLDDKSITVG